MSWSNWAPYRELRRSRLWSRTFAGQAAAWGTGCSRGTRSAHPCAGRHVAAARCRADTCRQCGRR
eukprot:2817013-Prymnesium_polylepis.2